MAVACVARFFYAINHKFSFAGNVYFFIMLPGRKIIYNIMVYSTLQARVSLKVYCNWLRVQITAQGI